MPSISLHRLALFGAVALVLGYTAGSALAADKGKPQPVTNIFADAPVAKLSWTGFYVGAHGGYSAATGEISGAGFALDGLSAHGLFGGGTVGADWQPGGTAIVVGARCGYTWSDSEFSVTSGGTTFAAHLDDGWHCDGRAGWAMGTALLYAGGGYGKSKTSLSLTGSGSVAGPDLDARRYFLGVEWRIPSLGTGSNLANPTLALEYLREDYDTVPLGSSANLNVDNNSFMGRLNIRFFDGYKAPTR